MTEKDYMDVRVDVKSAEIVEKLDILRLERGIPNGMFIMQAIAEKLQRDGYLQNGTMQHQRKEHREELSDVEQLRRSLQRISMQYK